jgi:hypothetical protein
MLQQNCALNSAAQKNSTLLSIGTDRTPQTIEAERIVLRDSHGRARITIGTPKFAGFAFDSEPDDPITWLTDENRADRATLSMGGLRFGNGHLKPLVELTSDPRPGRS